MQKLSEEDENVTGWPCEGDGTVLFILHTELVLSILGPFLQFLEQNNHKKRISLTQYLYLMARYSNVLLLRYNLFDLIIFASNWLQALAEFMVQIYYSPFSVVTMPCRSY